MNDQVRFLQLGVSFTLGILFHILYIQVNVPAVIFKSMCLSFYCCLFFFFFFTHFSILRKLRWHSFQNSHRPSVTSASLEINRQSAAQLNLLQKFSLLRLTAILEKHTDTTKHGWNWLESIFSFTQTHTLSHTFQITHTIVVQGMFPS